MNLFPGNFEELEQKLSAHSRDNKKEFKPDERFWKLSKDDNGNGTAIIRLLPDKNGSAYFKMFNHAVGIWNKASGKKRWYIEDSPSTIGQPCPASELWTELNAVGTDEAKEEAKKFSRKIQYITNILVVKDPANPENNGKVFLWKYGTKLHDKFVSVMNPSEDELDMGEKPVPLYHAMKGANIKLKIKKASGFFNYDDTTIMSPSEAFDDREEAEDVILNKTHDLKEFEDPAHYKTYEELADKLAFVRGLSDEGTKKAPKKEEPKISTMDDDDEDEDEIVESKPAKKEPKKEPKKEAPAESSSDDDDDDLDFLDEL